MEHLAELLNDNGIILTPRSSEEILNKLSEIQENKYIQKMVCLICDFIKNFKTNGYNEDKFYEFIRLVKSERTRLFLEICKECYLEYQRTLSRNNAVDFQDMINDAARALREVAALKEKLHFKYIIIDEYQDISRQRFDLAQELSKVTNAKIVAVGDDWQSIFAFSGSDVTLFTKFCEKMGYGEELKITRTYRNAQEVINIAGGFIQKNSAQIKKDLSSPKHIEDPVIVVSYDDSPKKWNERATEGGPLHKMAQALEYSIGEIVARHGEKTSILLIGRYNYDGEALSRTGNFEYNSHGNKVVSKKYPQVDITFLTAHSSKGLGYDNVIIINAKDAVYGFPSKIEDDPVMKLVIKQADEMEYAEERRLFYVALTRTKNRVYIIAPEKHPSEFVLEIKEEYKNIVLKGEFHPEPHGLLTNKICPLCGYPLQRRHKKDCAMNLWVCTNEPEICGFVSNNLVGGKMYIQKCMECVDGYLVVKTKDGAPFLGCTNYTHDGKGCNNTVSPQDFETTVKYDEIIEIEIVEEEADSVADASDQTPLIFEEDVQTDTTLELSENEGVSVESIEEAVNNDGSDIDESYEGKTEKCAIVLDGKGVVRIIITACEAIGKVQRFGVSMLVNVLRGSKAQRLLDYKLDELDCYGALKWIKKEDVFNIIEILVEENFLFRTRGLYPSVRVNREKTLTDVDVFDCSIIEDILEENRAKSGHSSKKDEGAETINIDGFEVHVDEDGEIITDVVLLKNLQKLRNKLADEQFYPAYIVAKDDLLVRLATVKPLKREEFLKIKGIRDRWFERYGEVFIHTIKQHLENDGKE